MATPTYRAQVFAFGASNGIGTLLAEFEQGMNLGWATYANDVPECFFTVNAEDPKLPLVASYAGKAHLRILRGDDIVWAGWFGMEVDSRQDDVIFYSYGYLAGFYWSLSPFAKEYLAATGGAPTIGTIVSDAWTAASGATGSMLAFVATGTIETPPTVTGGGTGITLDSYSMYNKRYLFMLREMAALGMSDTQNRVLFEITHSATPTFNFWKNAGGGGTGITWRYGDDKVMWFRDYRTPIYRRNSIVAAGSAPNNALMQQTITDATDVTNYGLRQEPLYFTWVRDATELSRVTKFRATRAKRDRTDLVLTFYANSVPPLGSSNAGYVMLDTPHVTIARGMTSLDTNFLVVGAQVLFVNGNEYNRVLLQEVLGT